MTESGISAYGEHAWTRVRLYSSKSLEFLEASAPEYYKAVTEFSTPYVKLAGELCLIFKNTSIKFYNNIVSYAHQKGPLIASSVSYPYQLTVYSFISVLILYLCGLSYFFFQQIDHYAPGLLDNVTKQSILAIEAIKTYSALASDQANILV